MEDITAWHPTPSDDGVMPESNPGRSERTDDHRMKVESFDQHPEEIRHEEIVEQHHYALAEPLSKNQMT